MARSATRQALKKGGNFMGMMNVLMQLRKVCNHPDLFEPRSVITPFALDPIGIAMPTIALTACDGASVLEKVSSSLISQIWSGSQGQPSISAALNHDTIESSELLELEKALETNIDQQRDHDNLQDLAPALQKYLVQLNEKEKSDEIENKEFLNGVNSIRCRSSPFVFPSRLICAVTLDNKSLGERRREVLSSPSQLLAVRRSHMERAEDVDHLIKRFVFCVPKAGAKQPMLSVNTRSARSGSKSLNSLLLEPCEEYFKPFREAHARLTSFFPDKKLVQFDAGKLQTLSELLRELKRGGHRCLVFTQMSKMLDILEAFLNLNGHTYLRLDGSTGVERRQRLMDRFNNDTKMFCFILSTRSGGLGINLTGADTVIFYDSDWNPAMDAQAQVS